jgi:Na+/proline symporter
MDNSFILLTIILYFSILLFVAWITGRNDSHNDAFFTAHKQAPWFLVSIGMIGASLSGVTFVSVPGMVRAIDFTYMQTVCGFFCGYLFIAHFLLPIYYRLNLTSIYSWIEPRIGPRAYFSAAAFFFLSKIIGAAARLYLVALILHSFVFDAWHFPFPLTVALSLFLVWLYTFRSGLKTIIWTDTLQAICLVAMLCVLIFKVNHAMNLDLHAMIRVLADSPHCRFFEFNDWHSTQHFVKQFFSGIFITIVMTGLDQDMMQKNLACRSLHDAKKNMYAYGFTFIPVNLLFLALGALLLIFAANNNIPLPTRSDDILPFFCTSGIFGPSLTICFTIGIIAAAFSSADSALTALTTSFCVDILHIHKLQPFPARRLRLRVHIAVTILFGLIILFIQSFNSRSVIDAIYMIASYTYGPLLGLFAFGFLTKRRTPDAPIPFICIASPLLCFLTAHLAQHCLNYTFGYETLILNGALTFLALLIPSRKPLAPTL